MSGPSRIVIRGSANVGAGNVDAAKKAFEDALTQIEQDVISGTFGEFGQDVFADKEAFHAFQQRARKLAKIEEYVDRDARYGGELPFVLTLDANLFRDPNTGMQKLVHVLVSDIFERKVPGFDAPFRIRDVNLGELGESVARNFRPKSHSISSIKAIFGLKPEEPLLAFSVKPRVGLTFGELKKVATEVWDAGFHIVEMDTRDLDFSQERRAELLALSQAALDRSKGGKIRRFSVNAGGPPFAAAGLLRDLAKAHEGKPWVVKIDGNLDGLSLVQALRRGDILAADQPQPIVTCYPLLKYALTRYLGENTLVQMLAHSGVDIVYPGKRPSFDNDKAIDGERINPAREHYRAMRMGDYPMLSVAGGITAGQTHAFYTTLGSDIAYFVGGGVTLAPNGIGKGAKSFRAAVDLAVKESAKARWSESDLAKAFETALQPGFATNGVIEPKFAYVNPVTTLLRRRVTLTVGPDDGFVS